MQNVVCVQGSYTVRAAYDCKIKGYVTGAQLKLAATLRSRTAGPQDESRCSAIHKFNCDSKRAGGTPALLMTTAKSKAPA
jgi:hypothetical protein